MNLLTNTCSIYEEANHIVQNPQVFTYLEIRQAHIICALIKTLDQLQIKNDNRKYTLYCGHIYDDIGKCYLCGVMNDSSTTN